MCVISIIISGYFFLDKMLRLLNWLCSTKTWWKTAAYLKGFTEHVFSFFTPQQVDDHLFAVQLPQCSEVPGLNKQKPHEGNITKHTC